MTQLSFKLIALFKVIRGTAALFLAFGFWYGSDHGIQQIESLPNWLREVTRDQLFNIASLFFALAFIRYCEAIGLWLNQIWAQYLAVITGVIGIAFFTAKLIHQFDGVTLIIWVLNLAIVVYLIRVIQLQKKSSI